MTGGSSEPPEPERPEIYPVSVGMLAEKVGLSYRIAGEEIVNQFVSDYQLTSTDLSYLGGNPWSEIGTIPLDSRLGISPNTSLYGSASEHVSALSMQTLQLFLEQAWSAFALTEKVIDGQKCYLYRIYANGTAYYPIIAREGIGPTIFDTNSFAYLYKIAGSRPTSLESERDLFNEIRYGDKQLVNLHNNT